MEPIGSSSVGSFESSVDVGFRALYFNPMLANMLTFGVPRTPVEGEGG